MKYARFKRKVLQCEALARENPGAYSRKIFFTVLGGYTYIFFLAVLGLAGMALIIMSICSGRHASAADIKLLIFLGIFEFLVLAGIFARIRPPKGIELSREKFPDLFALIEEVTSSTRSPSVAKVLVDDQFNASVCQIPRLGILGWTRHYLVLGYPLMASMSPEHFKAVLAHEFGHISRNHSAFSLWIYRANIAWASLAASCSQGFLKILIHPFAKFYVPYLNAVTFPAGRTHEYEADAIAARVVGPELIAGALLSLEVQGCRFGEKVMKDFWNRTIELPDPPELSLYRMIGEKMREPLEAGISAEFVARGLRRKTSVADTHPSVEDRISALGCRPAEPAVPSVSAAEMYFGSELGSIVSELDGDWLKNCGEMWRMMHENAIRAARCVEDFEKKEYSTCPFEQKMDYAVAVECLRGEDKALEIFRKLAAEFPDSPVVSFSIGRLLLQKRSDEGLAHLKSAMKNDVTLTNPAVSLASAFLVEDGRPDELDSWYGIEEDSRSRIEKAQKEIMAFTARHSYLPHEVEPEIIEKTRELLRVTGKIRRAYLVRKKIVGPGSEWPVYLLAVETRFFSFCGDEMNFAIAEKLDFFPYQIFVIQIGFSQFLFRRKLSRVANSRLL